MGIKFNTSGILLQQRDIWRFAGDAEQDMRLKVKFDWTHDLWHPQQDAFPCCPWHNRPQSCSRSHASHQMSAQPRASFPPASLSTALCPSERLLRLFKKVFVKTTRHPGIWVTVKTNMQLNVWISSALHSTKISDITSTSEKLHMDLNQPMLVLPTSEFKAFTN